MSLILGLLVIVAGVAWWLAVSRVESSRNDDMCTESPSTADFEVLEQKISAVIADASSLDEIDAWLQSQKCVESVRLADYLLKSNPPQRDFIVEFRMADGTTVTKIINIFDLGNRRFRFHELRDE